MSMKRDIEEGLGCLTSFFLKMINPIFEEGLLLESHQRDIEYH